MNCGVNGAIEYKGTFLCPGSEGFKLLQNKRFQELDIHLKKLDSDYLKLHGEPSIRFAIGERL